MKKIWGKIKAFFIEKGIEQVAEIGEDSFEDLLQKLHDTKPELYEACIKGGHAFFKPLKSLAGATETKIDDVLVAAFHDAITDSAKEHGVELDHAGE